MILSTKNSHHSSTNGVVIKGGSYLLCIFLLNSLLKPVRDLLIVEYATEQLHWLFSASFAVTLLFAPVVSLFLMSLRIQRLIKLTHILYAILLLLIYFNLAQSNLPTPVIIFFFIICNLFNLLFTTLFWTMIIEFIKSDHTKTLSRIASGSTLGAILGPGLTIILSRVLPIYDLFLCGAALSLFAPLLLRFHASRSPLKRSSHKSSSFHLFQAKNLSLGILSYAAISSFLYVFIAFKLSSAQLPEIQIVDVFAIRDMITNVLTLVLQMALTHRLVRKYGVRRNLLSIPLFTAVLFASTMFFSSIHFLIGIQLFYRAGNLGVIKPLKEFIYTRIELPNRASMKSFIDTAVYRTGDMIGAWIFVSLNYWRSEIFLALAGLALSIIWAYYQYKIGLIYKQSVKSSNHLS